MLKLIRVSHQTAPGEEGFFYVIKPCVLLFVFILFFEKIAYAENTCTVYKVHLRLEKLLMHSINLDLSFRKDKLKCMRKIEHRTFQLDLQSSALAYFL